MINTRFPPSPTGDLHIGGVRTALFSWIYARKYGGKFVLRIEDTDQKRSTKEATEVIIKGMQWLGLNHDSGPFFQTKRFDRYAEVIDQLISQGDAYYCNCSKERLDALRMSQRAKKQKPKYDGHCRDAHHKNNSDTPSVIRFKNPISGSVIIDDLVKGKITVDNSELDDLIIVRSDGTPTYNFCVVVDDMDMQISHVIRGDDHVNNTPRQINILSALDASIPKYAHVPMILGADGTRLSKRHGALSLLHYRDEGYLPEALLNYLVRLGWSYGEQEIFTIDEMVSYFDLDAVNVAPSTFNQEKLLWVNQQHIMKAKPENLVDALKWQFKKIGVDIDSGIDLTRVIVIQQPRVKTMKEMAAKSRYFYQEFDQYNAKAAKKSLVDVTPLRALLRAYLTLDDWQKESIHMVIKKTTEALSINIGKVAQPLRVAVTGGDASPAIDITLELIGKERTIQRIQKAIDFIEKNNNDKKNL